MQYFMTQAFPITELCYSIMLYFLSTMLLKGTKLCLLPIILTQFSLKMQCKTKEQNLTSYQELYCNIIEVSTIIPK